MIIKHLLLTDDCNMKCGVILELNYRLNIGDEIPFDRIFNKDDMKTSEEKKEYTKYEEATFRVNKLYIYPYDEEYDMWVDLDLIL